MKPLIHAKSSAKQFGGKPEDYLKIHDWFDATKSHFGDNRHRAILHSSFGIFLAEQVFGHIVVNADKKEVSVRDIGEQHVVEDLGFIPNISDYLSEMEYQPWMGGQGRPKSQQKLNPEIHVTEEVGESLVPPMVFDGSRPSSIRPHIRDGNFGGRQNVRID